MRTIERYGFLLQIIAVLVFLAAPFLFFPFPLFEAFPDSHFRYLLLSKVLVNLFLVGVFYLNLKVLTPSLLADKRIWKFMGILSVLLFTLFLLDMMSFHFIDKAQGFKQFPPPEYGPSQGKGFGHKPPMPMGRGRWWLPMPQQISNFISFIMVVVSGSLIVLLRDRMRDREDRQQIVLEKVKAELAVLKHQISPHFLFNTLNNIRWLARQKSDRTEEAILQLSQLLRYMLYQVNSETVTLDREVDYLRRYIDLQKMRLSEHTRIDFEVAGNTASQLIEPLLLIPFVENAFKYGVHSQEPSVIKIRIETSFSQIVFSCESTVFEHVYPGIKEESGLGILNVRRRLELYYPHKHDLSISEVDGKFIVRLVLKIE